MDDAQLNIFKLQLNELDLQWEEMEPALRDTLRLNEKAREDFLAIHKRAHLQAYDPKAGGFTEEAAEARKRDFEVIEEAAATVATVEGVDPRVNEAMMKYHSASVLPNMTKLFEQCGIFYGQVLAETAQQQRVSAQLQSLEKSRANKTVLLHELPPFTSKRTLDNNIYHFLQGAGLKDDDVTALHNHLVTSASAVVRV